MTVIPLASSTACDPVNRNTGIGEALAFKIIRLCVSTMWSAETKKKARITPEKMRAEFARIIYQVQWLKKVSRNGSTFASLELVSLLSTLDMFEMGMLNKEMLGVDKR